MRPVAYNKYTLRDLHREIDLLDRKLVHLSKFETFETEALRDAAVRKATTKRDNARTQAQAMIDMGIEYDAADLPRSLRKDLPAEEAEAPADSAEAATDAPSEEVADFGAPTAFGERIALMQKESTSSSPLMAWQNDLAAYKRRRQKAVAL